MKLQHVWLLESAKNLPLILGFVVSARLWQENLPAALATLVVGMGTGIAVTRSVEPRLHKERYEMRPRQVIINFVVFVGLSIPFLYYFRIENSWLNWKTDLLGGVIAAILLTLGQNTVWQGEKARMLLHGIAMSVSFPIIMIGLRYIIQMQDWGISLLLGVLLTFFASLVIAGIDYQEMYQPANK